MKKITSILSAGIIVFIASCGNSDNQATDTTVADSASEVVVTTEASAEPAFTPFKAAIIQHTVKNFDKWREIYMAHDSTRLAYGLNHFRLGRGLEDSNMVMVVNIINDLQKANEFSASPELKTAMKNAGVIGPPAISFVDIIRLDSSMMEQKERVRITHRVKDFDAWLKVYDNEGKDSRAAHGLIDVGLSRRLDDPNMVSIVFAISNMEKAKARMNDPELKALMMTAGVEGPPVFFYYRLAE